MTTIAYACAFKLQDGITCPCLKCCVKPLDIAQKPEASWSYRQNRLHCVQWLESVLTI